MSRQQEAVTSIRIYGGIEIESEKGAQAFYKLMSSQVKPVIGVKVLGSMGEVGWQEVANAMQLQPGVVEVGHIVASKTGLEEARKEDINKIWETVASRGFDIFKTAEEITLTYGPYAPVAARKHEDDWGRLEQILLMSEAEFAAEIGEDDELWHEGEYNPVESEDEDSEGEEGEDEDVETEEEDE